MNVHNEAKRFVLLNVWSKLSSYQLFWIASFSLLTAVSAQIAVPVKPVPFTLQTMMVLLSGAFLGSKNGAYSQLIYIFLGLAGFPVFANGSMGIGVLFGPTGGYLLAFPAAAFLVGYLVEIHKNYFFVVFSMFVGSLMIIAVGVLFLNLFFVNNILEAIKVGGAIFSIWMVVKVFAAASIYFGISKKYSRLPR
jgi:biotin transport system substrate-specific component